MDTSFWLGFAAGAGLMVILVLGVLIALAVLMPDDDEDDEEDDATAHPEVTEADIDYSEG